jgi:hypothetical protein
VSTSEVYLWPQTIGERAVLSTLKFLETIGFHIRPRQLHLLVKDEVLLFVYVNKVLLLSKTKQAYNRFGHLFKSELKIKQFGKFKLILGVSVE